MHIEGFTSIDLIGSGPIGTVYRATRNSTDAEVAIKVLRQWQNREIAWVAASAELRAAVDLSGHPNVVHIDEFVQTDHQYVIVMEYAPGGSLIDLMGHQDGTLDVGQGLLVGSTAAHTLADAHARGIIHHNIKPTNLLIDGFGQVKISDFGTATLAKSEGIADDTRATNSRFMSPEELDSFDEVTGAVDVYSLASVLYYSVIGRFVPSNASDRDATLVTWSQAEPDELDIRRGFADALNPCFERDPAARPSAADLSATLQHLSSRGGGVRQLPVIRTSSSVDATVPRDRLSDAQIGATGTGTAPTVVIPHTTTLQQTSPAVPDAAPSVFGYSEAPYATAASQQAGEAAYVQAAPPPRRNGLIWLIVAAALVVAVCAAGTLLYTSTRDKPVAEPVGGASDSSTASTESSSRVKRSSAATEVPTPQTAVASTSGTVPVTVAAAVVEVVTTTTSTTTTTPVPLDPEVVARGQVDEFVNLDRPTIAALNDWYVPQLSAKQYNWIEPDTGRLILWADLLEDHLAFRNRDHGAVLAAPNEFDATPGDYYFTWVPVRFSSKSEVEAWCNSSGYVAGKTCIPRQVVTQ